MQLGFTARANLTFLRRVIYCTGAIFFFQSGVHATEGEWYASYNSPVSVERDSTIAKLYGTETRFVFMLNGSWQAKLLADKETYQDVTVPGVYDHEGIVDFRRTFEVDSLMATRQLKLVVLGIRNRGKIYLNDEFLTSHEAGYIPITVEFPPDKLHLDSPNELRIEVDNRLAPRSGVPLKHYPGIAKNYGGIFRDVFLVALPTFSIDDIKLTETFSDSLDAWDVHCRVNLRKTTSAKQTEDSVEPKFTLQVQLLDSTAAKVVAASDLLPIEFSKRVVNTKVNLQVKNASLWSPGSPYLYRLRAVLRQGREVFDQLDLGVGLRRVVAEENQLRLNGAPLTLLGLDWYEDFPGLGPAASLTDLRSDVLAIKDLGANAVRVVGCPPHPYFLDLCDQAGLLVFLELPLAMAPPQRFGETAFLELLGSHFQTTWEKHGWRPSFVGWSFGSDLPMDSSGFEHLLEKTHQAGPPLLFTVARFSGQPVVPEFDLVLLSRFDQDEVEPGHTVASQPSQNTITVPVVGYSLNYQSLQNAEDGQADAANHLTERDTIRIQEEQAYKLNRALTAMDAGDSTHVFIHSFSDWQSPLPDVTLGLTPGGDVTRSGLVNNKRQRRIAWQVVDSFFHENVGKKISVEIPEAVSPNIFPIAGVALILMFLFNFNRSRRLRGNFRRIFFFPHGFYTELRENRRVSGSHTVLLSLAIVASLAIIMTSVIYYFRDSILYNELLNLLIDSPAVKEKMIWLTWQPGTSILILMVVFYLIFALTIIILRFSAVILGQGLPTVQFATLVFWSAASLIWLLPLTPIYYRILDQTRWGVVAIALLALNLLWLILRSIRAVKVMFGFSILKTLILIIVLASVTLGGVSLYFDRQDAIFDYLPMYWHIIVAKITPII